VLDVPDARIVAARSLDAAYESELERLVGLPIRISPAEPTVQEYDGSRTSLRAGAMATEHPVTGFVASEGAYVSALPVKSRTGAVVAIVEASLARSLVSEPFRDVARNLFLLSLGVLAVATVMGFVLGRRLGKPVDALSDAAERIGRGDLATPIPHAPGREIGGLSTTMEEMRLRLLQLTAELRRRRAEAEAIVTGISEGVYTVDRERRIVYLNPQAATFLGVPAHEAIGRFCGDVLNPQGPDGVRPCDTSCPIVHARFRGNARATEHLLLPDGTRRTMVVASAPPVTSDEGVEIERQQFQVLRDETDIEATRRLRDTVLANISHEFKTPLSAQLASIELLQDRLRGDPPGEAAQLVSSLERGTLRLTHLIDNLLESVRIDAGRDSIRRAPVALDEVVEEAVELMSPLLAQKGQSIEADLPYPIPSVVGDAPRLVQVLVNLLANANKFAPAGTAVRIGGTRDGSTVSLWVEDEGPGLPPGSGQALFTRFYRAPGEEPEQSGMGLGLFIVKSIVERHGGAVAAKSLPRGTRITLTLPVAEGQGS
jgi:signal transduction histidine kinase